MNVKHFLTAKEAATRVTIDDVNGVLVAERGADTIRLRAFCGNPTVSNEIVWSTQILFLDRFPTGNTFYGESPQVVIDLAIEFLLTQN